MAQGNNKGMSAGAKAGIGVAAVAAAAAAAGAYFFYGSKDAAKNRKKMKTWMIRAKADVLEQLESMQEVSKDTYDQAVGNVLAKYEALKQVPAPELIALGKELRGHWKAITASVSSKSKKRAPARKKAPAKKKK